MSHWLQSRPPSRIPSGPIVLRLWRPDEATALARTVAESLDHLRPWMPWASRPPTLGLYRSFLADGADGFERGTDFVYGIFDPAERSILGGCGLHARIGPHALEIGYWVGRPYVRRGYATAAARGLLDAAFALPEVRRVEIHCDEANAASAAIPRRLGLRLDRIEPGAVHAPGEVGRSMIWVAERPGTSP